MICDYLTMPSYSCPLLLIRIKQSFAPTKTPTLVPTLKPTSSEELDPMAPLVFNRVGNMTWTAPANLILAEVLIVGGGGAGGYDGGGGGGGGGK
jgi:hypothetical protein